MRKPKGTIPNRRIDHYALIGYYGEDTRLKWIEAIRTGKIRTLQKEITAGEYGPAAQKALRERQAARPVKPHRKTTTARDNKWANEFLAELGLVE